MFLHSRRLCEYATVCSQYALKWGFSGLIKYIALNKGCRHLLNADILSSIPDQDQSQQKLRVSHPSYSGGSCRTEE